MAILPYLREEAPHALEQKNKTKTTKMAQTCQVGAKIKIKK